jgi:hypothetical protein
MLRILILQLANLSLFFSIIFLGVKQLFDAFCLEFVKFLFLLFHFTAEFNLLHLERVYLLVQLFEA